MRRLVKRYQIPVSHQKGSRKYYSSDDVDQYFGKYYARMHEPDQTDQEDYASNGILVNRDQYDQMVAALAHTNGRLEELERSREYWERERGEYRQEKAELQARIRELEEKIETYHNRPSFWRRLFRG